MLSRSFQIVLSVLIFICSTPAGMAQKAIREEVRAEFFVACEEVNATETEISADCESCGEAEQRAGVSTERFALLPSLWSAEQADSGVDGSKETKRVTKRASSHKIIISKCRILCSLSQKMISKGVSKHPESQDAEQERTAAVQFLQIAALA